MAGSRNNRELARHSFHPYPGGTCRTERERGWVERGREGERAGQGMGLGILKACPRDKHTTPGVKSSVCLVFPARTFFSAIVSTPFPHTALSGRWLHRSAFNPTFSSSFPFLSSFHLFLACSLTFNYGSKFRLCKTRLWNHLGLGIYLLLWPGLPKGK